VKIALSCTRTDVIGILASMQRNAKIKGQTISYQLKSSKRARRVGLTMDHSGGLIVTVPQKLPHALRDLYARAFVKEKLPWIERHRSRIRKTARALPIRPKNYSYHEHKEEAKAYITRKVSSHATAMRVLYNRVTVRDQKTCWGSCSEKKNLNFNFRLLFLPPRLADYVIIHELCHLKALNHSPAFWRLVANAMPDYKKHEKALKLYSILLR